MAQLWQILLERHPSLSEISQRCLLAVNQEYVEVDTTVPLRASDEVAVIPPVSGG